MYSGQNEQSREQGVVSLLTVIFFMVFISLIVIGFLTIVIKDQRQATDNDLSASALAAARSGVEDAKRILLYCSANPSDANCSAAIDSTDCNAFDSGKPANVLAGTLDIPLNTNGEGVTGGATAYEQYFTCLMIQSKTSSLSTFLSSDADYIQQLRTVSPFNQLKVSWSGTGTYSNRGTVTSGWPTLSSWTLVSSYLPVIQLQLIPYTNLNDLTAVEAATRTLYISPCDGGVTCPANPAQASILADMRSQPNTAQLRGAIPPIVYARCNILAVYDCSITLTGLDSAARYYVRATLLYADSTTLTLAALQNGTSVDFDNVQPQIDVTGRTNDVFRRVKAEVSYAPTTPLPRNALDSAAPICKDMTVTNAAATSTYNCN